MSKKYCAKIHPFNRLALIVERRTEAEMAISVPLVSGGELSAHLRDENVLVCDCRFAGDGETSRERYASGHIPGAIQPHGALLVCAREGLIVLQVSDNVVDHRLKRRPHAFDERLIGDVNDQMRASRAWIRSCAS